MTRIIAYGVAVFFILHGGFGFVRARHLHQNLLSRARADHAKGRFLARLNLFFLDVPFYVPLYRLLSLVAFCVGGVLLWALGTHTIVFS
ncbi:hypothetical protein [Azospirillum sp. B4]|uniref:hypothetical protein n=1 Tax=Azospirillum sp. B4 TaxID=95605 RepID=UPI0005C7F6CE|nr:hypothetical protein [Azospirillum sp. B4]